MRIATYNVEWFDALFDDAGAVQDGGAPSGRHGVTRADQAKALGVVFRALDADAVMVIEAPDTGKRRSTVRALAGFAEDLGLRANTVAMGFANDTQQEIALLYDPAALQVRHDPQATAAAPRFDTDLRIDLDIDDTEDRVVFSKPPLELAVETASGTRLRLIGVHLKSKAPHGARTRDAAMRISIANRRKQLAQAIWLRRRVEQHLQAGEAVIVLGDLNDGPGLDEYEHLFGRSSVEIVLGQGDRALYDPHAAQALTTRFGARPTTARFYIAREDRYLQALLDYIMVSPNLRACAPQWRIWHPFDDRPCWQSADLRAALLTGSDHFPVTLDLDL